MTPDEARAELAAKTEAWKRLTASLAYIGRRYGQLTETTAQATAYMQQVSHAWYSAGGGGGAGDGLAQVPGAAGGSAAGEYAPERHGGSGGSAWSSSAWGGPAAGASVVHTGGSAGSPGSAGGGGVTAGGASAGSSGGGGGSSWTSSGGNGSRFSFPVLSTDGFSEAGGPPLVAGSVTGYRWWTLAAPDLTLNPLDADEDWDPEREARLRGVMADWQPGVNQAACLSSANHDPGTIPVKRCGCVVPGTRILTADLQWVPAGDLNVGDRLVAFDEYPSEPGFQRQEGRKYREAVVASVDRDRLPCWDLEFDDGTKVRVSSDHRWLCTAGLDGAHWVETAEMRRGEQRATHVVKPFKVWETDESREAGYLAAAFDGEGCLFQHKHRYQFHTSFTQVDNPMLAEVERLLKESGYQFQHQVSPRGYNKPLRVDGSPRQDIHRLTIARRADLLRFLGTVRPVRLLPKFRPDVLGRLNLQTRVRLVGKTYVGYQEVVKLGTTTGTYVAEGLASHNCGYWAYWGLQQSPLTRDGALPVFGVIKGFGRTRVGPYGFRAGKARILAVHLPLVIGNREHLSAQARRELAQVTRPTLFAGRVISVGTDHVPPALGGSLHEPAPVPEPDPEAVAADKAKGEAWLAVIGDRIEQLYPGVRVFETRDALLKTFPPDAVYGQGQQA